MAKSMLHARVAVRGRHARDGECLREKERAAGDEERVREREKEDLSSAR